MEFKKILEEVKKEVTEKKSSEAIKAIIKKSGLEEYFNDGTEEGEMRLANIQELVTLAKRYDPPAGGSAPERILKIF